MANEEYKQFLKYIFNEYIRPRIQRIDRYFDHPKMWHHWHYEWRGLKRAIDLINYIIEHCEDTHDIYRTFTLDRLRKAVDEIEDGVRWNNRLAEETGFLDVLDSYYEEIVDGLDAELFPEAEYELMREIGFKDPRSDLRGIIYILQARKKKHLSYEVSVSQNLKNTVETLSKAREQFKRTDKNHNTEKPKKSRKWFKGLGQIGQGAALSIGNIALALGALTFPVSTETQTWGALVSATTGVGMIMNGVGELRGE